MPYTISRVEVWSGETQDRRGALADMLKLVLDAGADLDFIIGRPSPVKPATGILYVAPLEGEQQLAAARQAGLHPSSHIEALRVEGPDSRGLAERITARDFRRRHQHQRLYRRTHGGSLRALHSF